MKGDRLDRVQADLLVSRDTHDGKGLASSGTGTESPALLSSL
jgi:hypothetical protein